MLPAVEIRGLRRVDERPGDGDDDALAAVAVRRIGAGVHDSDTVARLGGDELCVILADLADTRRVDAVAEDLVRTLGEPYPRPGAESVVAALSVGVALYPQDGVEIGSLLKAAELAMAAAEAQGGGRFCYVSALR